MESDKLFDLMTKIYTEMQEIKSEQSKTDEKLESLEAKVTKNTLLLEKVDSNVNLLAEGQEAFREQLGRNKEDDSKTITERLQIIELAITSNSKTISQLNDAVEVIKNTTSNNDMDIKILKRHVY